MSLIPAFEELTPNDVNDQIASKIMQYYSSARKMAESELGYLYGVTPRSYDLTPFNGLYCHTKDSTPLKFDPYHDLNDCFLFEEEIMRIDGCFSKNQLLTIYHISLIKLSGGDGMDIDDTFKVAHATASQRCEAALTMLQKTNYTILSKRKNELR